MRLLMSMLMKKGNMAGLMDNAECVLVLEKLRVNPNLLWFIHLLLCIFLNAGSHPLSLSKMFPRRMTSTCRTSPTLYFPFCLIDESPILGLRVLRHPALLLPLLFNLPQPRNFALHLN